MAKILKPQEIFPQLFEEKKIHSVGFKSMGMLLMAFSLVAAFLPIPVRISALLIAVSLFLKGRQAAQEGENFFANTTGKEIKDETFTSIPKEWRRIDNLALGKSNIDHVLVCPKGVYTINTKRYGGTIDGALDERTWGQTSPDGSRSIFFNPVKEASGHAAELQKYLQQAGFQDVRVKPIVVFIEPAARIRVSSLKVPVIRSLELGDLLRAQPHIMMPEKCAEIAKLLENSKQRSKKLAKKLDKPQNEVYNSIPIGALQAKNSDAFLDIATFLGFSR